MAITVGTITQQNPRNRGLQAAYTTFALDASYATGGYALADVLDVVGKLKDHEIVLLVVQPTATYFFEWVRSTGKLLVRVLATGAEVANATNLAAVTGLEATILTQ